MVWDAIGTRQGYEMMGYDLWKLEMTILSTQICRHTDCEVIIFSLYDECVSFNAVRLI